VSRPWRERNPAASRAIPDRQSTTVPKTSKSMARTTWVLSQIALSLVRRDPVPTVLCRGDRGKGPDQMTLVGSRACQSLTECYG
jgi:hypothetical protein